MYGNNSTKSSWREMEVLNIPILKHKVVVCNLKADCDVRDVYINHKAATKIAKQSYN